MTLSWIEYGIVHRWTNKEVWKYYWRKKRIKKESLELSILQAINPVRY